MYSTHQTRRRLALGVHGIPGFATAIGGAIWAISTLKIEIEALSHGTRALDNEFAMATENPSRRDKHEEGK